MHSRMHLFSSSPCSEFKELENCEHLSVPEDEKKTHTDPYGVFTLSAPQFEPPTVDHSGLPASSIGCHGNVTNCMQNKS